MTERDDRDLRKVFPLTAHVDDGGALAIGGMSIPGLAERFGTPLIVFDRATFEVRAKSFAASLEPANVIYAAKALCCVAVCEIVDSLGLSLDVCSGGELHTAMRAGFPMERVVFHGNNKSVDELRMARDAAVGRIVIDSFDEIERIKTAGVATNVMVRVTPGVEAHTHEYVQTGQEDSKFGFTVANGIALEAMRRASELSRCRLTGVHAHIGSQIFEMDAFDLAVERLADLLDEAKRAFGFEAEEVNLGGGLGIAYTRDEPLPDPSGAIERIEAAVEREFAARGLTRPRLLVEPGRSLIGPAAVTVYRVGTIKEIPGVRTFVAVDGGMSDNIRPALYGARYEAVLANRVRAELGPRVTVCGKHCESGDILIKDVHLPEDVTVGDLLCVPATGAYTYSMANNYNRVARPPIVMVQDGDAIEIVRRETLDDLLRLDRRADGSDL